MLSKIYNSAKQGAGKLGSSLSGLLRGGSNTHFVDMEAHRAQQDSQQPKLQQMHQPEPQQYAQAQQPPLREHYQGPQPKSQPQAKVIQAIRELESSGGLDPNTPRNQQRSYTTVPANQNEQARTIQYDVGYGGEYGLTPVALASLAGSKINHEADPSTYTQYGKPLTPGMDPQEIQRKLNDSEGAGMLSYMFFQMQREDADNFSPEALTDDYINNYWGLKNADGTDRTPEEIAKNRARVLEVFTRLMN